MKTKLLLLGIVISLTKFVAAHVGDDFYNHHGMMWSSKGMYWGISWFWIIITILIVTVLILIIILLYKKIKEKK